MSDERFRYQPRCSCGAAAVFKIAAPWSDARQNELKNYGLACANHVRERFEQAKARCLAMPDSDTESVGEIGIYRLGSSGIDTQLERMELDQIP